MSLRKLPGRVLWRMPLRFGIANLLGPAYGLRCVLFHDISDTSSPFTEGLGVSLSKGEFEARIKFLTEHYTPVGLDDVLHGARSKRGRPPVLVTFDDAYRSVATEAGPICQKYGVPVLFFVNAALVDNRDLGLDNLICYLANTQGVGALNVVAREVRGDSHQEMELVQLFSEFLPTLSLPLREEFRARLAAAAKIDPAEAARQAQLYVTSEQLRQLVSCGFEIGNHTYSHVHCRALNTADFAAQIDANKQALETLVGRRVRSFSVPYGYSADLGRELADHLRGSGHEAVFLVESRMNTRKTDLHRLYRVSVQPGTDADLFGELEILPRLRSIGDLVRRPPAPAVQ